jgi:hypothetical protein
MCQIIAWTATHCPIIPTDKVLHHKNRPNPFPNLRVPLELTLLRLTPPQNDEHIVQSYSITYPPFCINSITGSGFSPWSQAINIAAMAKYDPAF